MTWRERAEADAGTEECAASPTWTGDSFVPLCSEDGCGHYDGKRCRLLGSRPSYICEPVTREMGRRLTMVLS